MSGSSQGWALGLGTSLVLGGLVMFGGDYAKAQITPDDTLGNEPSVVKPNVDIKGQTSDLIEGGATRGANLFHSFLEFNVGEGRGAYFANPVGIQNIVGRVTGTGRSDILGTLGVQGNANLFLLNPNGIIFGPNAKLDMGGSFVGSTANGIKFADGFEFSATDSTTPPLLTISVPIGLQYGGTSGGIRVQGSSLQVKPGQTLALVGGNVSMNGGSLKVPGGRVELGGLTATGTVGLTVNGNDVRLSFPDSVPRADISLTQGALVNVTAGGGGSIHVNAGNIHLDNSFLLAGIGQNLGSPGSVAGDIEINARGTINLANKSLIINRVESGAVGQGGNVKLTTRSLSVTNGAQLQTLTDGLGNAGSVNINAHVQGSFDGLSSDGFPSGAFSKVTEDATGQGGNVKITTGSLSVTNGAQLQTLTDGLGNAGSVNIQAADTVIFDEKGSTGYSSGAFSFVESGATGNGGDVNLTTRSLFVTKGAALATSTSGVGNAGNVKIFATDRALFEGMGSTGGSSGAFSIVLPEAEGQGGNVNIHTGLLSVTNGAQLNASTYGSGDSGSVTITARDAAFFNGGDAFSQVGEKATGQGGNVNVEAGSLSVTNGAQLNTAIFGRGNGGNVIINVKEAALFDGVDNNGSASGAFSTVEAGGIGKAGDVKIAAGSVSVTNGAQLQSQTRGQGDAGSVMINARDAVSFNGVGSTGQASGAFSQVESEAIGNGGGISITARSLSLTEGAGLFATTLGQGKAGNILVNTAEFLTLSGLGSNGLPSGLFSNTEKGARGQGGDITVNTRAVRVVDRAVLNTQTLNSNKGGDITINANTFEVANGGQVFTTSFSSGNAGNITVNATDNVTLSGSAPIPTHQLAQSSRNARFFSGLFANTASSSTGDGGNVSIHSNNITISDGAGVAVGSAGTGNAGNLKIWAADSVTLERNAFLSTATASGEGGNASLRVGNLLLMRHNSLLSTEARGTGNGGNITIDASKGFIVGVSRENSDITANAFEGNGGNINIEAQRIFGLQERPKLTDKSDITASSEFGLNGEIGISELALNPNNGLASLPGQPLPEVIEPKCQIGSRPGRNKFTVIGRGGLPSNPTQTFGYNPPWIDMRPDLPGTENSSSSPVDIKPTRSAPKQIVEAQGWVINDDGKVELVAVAPQATLPQQTPVACDSQSEKVAQN